MTRFVVVVLVLGAARGIGGAAPVGGAAPKAVGAFGQFSLCRLAKHAESVVEAKVVDVGSPTQITANGFTETVIPVSLSVSAVIKGRDPGVVTRAVMLPQQLFVRDLDGGVPGAVMFLAPIVNGGLGVHPCGGAFFDIGGDTLVNNGFYRGGVSRKALVNEIGGVSSSAICPDEVGLAEQVRPWQGTVRAMAVDAGFLATPPGVRVGLPDGG